VDLALSNFLPIILELEHYIPRTKIAYQRGPKVVVRSDPRYGVESVKSRAKAAYLRLKASDGE
jgi:hypothetical protein